MKATGIVRRIDDLGRIVIPKEIRRTLHIRESDPLEIFTDREGQVILKKYSPIGEMTTFARQYAESLAQVSGHAALIADRDQFIAAAGGYNPSAARWTRKYTTGKPLWPRGGTEALSPSAMKAATNTSMRPSPPSSVKGISLAAWYCCRMTTKTAWARWNRNFCCPPQASWADRWNNRQTKAEAKKGRDIND